MKMKILLILVWCFYAKAMNYNSPINPVDWQTIAGTGFATNYFKTTNYRKFKAQNIQDIFDRGFRNLRLRCRTDLDNLDMQKFLNQLNVVVDKCLEIGVVPVISWINHHAEAYASDKEREAYLDWWEDVARSLKDKDYRLAFNLFTEIGTDGCRNDCSESLYENIDKYSEWTSEVIKRIRNAGGNNRKRIIILGAPRKTGDSLKDIPSKIYQNEDYMMAEWHIYASGPNKEFLNNGKPSKKYWKGNGNNYGKSNVDKAFKYAKDWTKETGIETYFGAWMPQDNKKGSISTDEAIKFSRYFMQELKPIPWTLNVLDVYYDTKRAVWKSGKQRIKGRLLDIPKILSEIIKARDETKNDEDREIEEIFDE